VATGVSAALHPDRATEASQKKPIERKAGACIAGS
jgi:hypothetical protein